MAIGTGALVGGLHLQLQPTDFEVRQLQVAEEVRTHGRPKLIGNHCESMQVSVQPKVGTAEPVTLLDSTGDGVTACTSAYRTWVNVLGDLLAIVWLPAVCWGAWLLVAHRSRDAAWAFSVAATVIAARLLGHMTTAAFQSKIVFFSMGPTVTTGATSPAPKSDDLLYLQSVALLAAALSAVPAMWRDVRAWWQCPGPGPSEGMRRRLAARIRFLCYWQSEALEARAADYRRKEAERARRARARRAVERIRIKWTPL